MTDQQHASVGDMAAAREARAAKQRQLLADRGAPLICLTMNIAGPVKLNGLIRQAFEEGVTMLSDTLAAHHAAVLYREECLNATGPEAFFLVDGDPKRLKRLTTALEDRGPLGRLMDVDVIRPDGNKVSRADVGQPSRRCLICAEPASACARSRTHPADELFSVSMRIIREHFEDLFAQDVSAFAVRALLTELAVTPKPGMVDRRNSGSHRDMDFFTFLDSAAALAPYFQTCARLGLQAGSPEECFPKIRVEGALAEGRMLRVTGGANTHRGAVFSLGILCAAAGYAWSNGMGTHPEALSAVSVRMTADALRREMEEMERPRTFGEALMKGRLAGARAEAAAGFPIVMHVALPALDGALAEGRTLNEACVRALMAVMTVAEDSVFLRRAGPERTEQLRRMSSELLAHGCPKEGLEKLDAQCIIWNVSFGGSADLLAAALFLRLLRESGFGSRAQDAEEAGSTNT